MRQGLEARLRTTCTRALTRAVAAFAVVPLLLGSSSARAAIADHAAGNGDSGYIKLTNAPRWHMVERESAVQCPTAAGQALYASKGLDSQNCPIFITYARGTVTASGPFTNTSLDAKYLGDTVWELEFYGAAFDAGQTGGDVQTVNLAGDGYLWVQHDGYLVNVLQSDTEGVSEVLTAQSTAHIETLLVQPITSDDWQNWTLP